MSGTGIDVPNLVTEVSGNGIDVVMNLPKCPVPAINTVGMYRRYASVCTIPNAPLESCVCDLQQQLLQQSCCSSSIAAVAIVVK